MQDPALRALAACDAPPDFSGEGIALAFGRSATGAIVHISEARSGLACGCSCPARGVARDAGPRAIAAAILRDGPRRWLFNERVEAAQARLEVEERRIALRRRDLRAQQVEAVVAALAPIRPNGLAEEAADYGDALVGRAFAGDWCL